MLVRLCSKSFKLGFNSIRTKNFQMFKLDLEKAEEPEIKLPTSSRSQKAREFQKNIYFSFIDCAKVLTVWITANWTILQETGIQYHLTLPASCKTGMQVKKQL